MFLPAADHSLTFLTRSFLLIRYIFAFSTSPASINCARTKFNPLSNYSIGSRESFYEPFLIFHNAIPSPVDPTSKGRLPPPEEKRTARKGAGSSWQRPLFCDLNLHALLSSFRVHENYYNHQRTESDAVGCWRGGTSPATSTPEVQTMLRQTAENTS